MPHGTRSTVWLLVADDASTAIVTTDDLELDVFRRSDTARWTSIYGISHRDDMLSRNRCRLLARLLCEDMRRAGMTVPDQPTVELPESVVSDMHRFHELSLIALSEGRPRSSSQSNDHHDA